MAYINQVKKGNTIYTIHDDRVDSKQDTLVSGSNIKTINGRSILGSGNINISGGGGSGASGFTYVVTGRMEYDRKDDEIKHIDDLESTQSWSDVEEAINNDELIYIDTTLTSCEYYLNKTTTLENSSISAGANISIPDPEYDESQGPESRAILQHLEPGDTFQLAIGVDANLAFQETRNRLVINCGSDLLQVNECYYMENESKEYLEIYSDSWRLYSAGFYRDEYENFPTLHISFTATNYIDEHALCIGYERCRDKDDFDEEPYANDYNHTGTVYRIVSAATVEDQDGEKRIQAPLVESLVIYCMEDEIDIEHSDVIRYLEDIAEDVDKVRDNSRIANIEYRSDQDYVDIDWNNLIRILYTHDQKEGYYLKDSDRINPTMRLRIVEGGNCTAMGPVYMDYSAQELPYSGYSEDEIINALKKETYRSQIGNTVYTIKQKKQADINTEETAPYSPNYYADLDTSEMRSITVAYDDYSGKWIFNREFSDIFSDYNKQHGILLTVENSYYYDSNIGYHMEYIEAGKDSYWEETPYTFTMPVLFDDDRHFIGAYEFSQDWGDEDSEHLDWIATIAIEVTGNMTLTSKDLAAIPTLSIIRGFTTNINGFELQTFTASDIQYDPNGYPYYVIYRNGETLTYNDAADYMEYMTGSRYVPVFDYQKPLNSIFINSYMQLFKPQFDDNGLKLYVIPTGLQQ